MPLFPIMPARRTAQSLSAARRKAEGAYVQHWRCSQVADSCLDADALVEVVLAWCRETSGRSRRPWGIDRLDLAVAVTGEGGAPRSMALRWLQPGDLYGEDTAGGLRRFFAAHTPAAKSCQALIAVALFSWGDAAHRVLPAL